ncbi:MAG: flippase-like domain-containing protein [Flavobacteriales bacterium]|nr:flippase-like domain-containing protein [Flavobacteriales bacterium]
MSDALKLQSWSDLHFESPELLILVVLLMPINWLLEAKKWQLLTEKFKSMSLLKALRSVLVGVYFTMFTPNRIGEGIGRVQQLGPGEKTRGTYAFLVGSGAQILATLIFGLLGLIYFSLMTKETWTSPMLTIMLVLVIVLGIVLYTFPLQKTSQNLQNSNLKGWRAALSKRITSLQEYGSAIKAKVMAISFLRYVIFTLQFTLLIHAFTSVDLVETFLRISCLYLASTLIPTFALSEIGIREGVAIFLFSNTQVAVPEIFIATLGIWAINLLVPALLGAFFFVPKTSKIAS